MDLSPPERRPPAIMPEIRYIEATRILRLAIAQHLWIPRGSAGQYQFRQQGQRDHEDRPRTDWLEVSPRLGLEIFLRVGLLTGRVGLVWESTGRIIARESSSRQTEWDRPIRSLLLPIRVPLFP
jgi:hypothetical protein